jgi:hypothetical protein
MVFDNLFVYDVRYSNSRPVQTRLQQNEGGIMVRNLSVGHTAAVLGTAAAITIERG